MNEIIFFYSSTVWGVFNKQIPRVWIEFDVFGMYWVYNVVCNQWPSVKLLNNQLNIKLYGM